MHAGDVCVSSADPETRLRGTCLAISMTCDSMSIGRRMLTTKVARFSLTDQEFFGALKFSKINCPTFKPSMLVTFVWPLRVRKRVCEAPTSMNRDSMTLRNTWETVDDLAVVQW